MCPCRLQRESPEERPARPRGEGLQIPRGHVQPLQEPGPDDHVAGAVFSCSRLALHPDAACPHSSWSNDCSQK